MPETRSIEIHGIAIGGSAVGRVTAEAPSGDSGMTAFVPFAIPGETITATVTDHKKSFLRGDLLTIDHPSESRVTPPCPHFGICGGCDLQHMEYTAQLAAKQAMIQSEFARTFRATESPEDLETLLALLHPPVPSQPYTYRGRITLHLGADGQLGYYQRGSHTLMPVKACPISEEPLQAFLQAGITLPGSISPDGTAILALETGANGVFATLRTTHKLRQATLKTIQDRLEPHTVGGRVEVENVLTTTWGDLTVLREVFGETVRTEPGVFAQVNTGVNELLLAEILRIAAESGAKTAYDLYAGAGNFALPLAATGVRVTAVEMEPALAQAGKAESIRRGLESKLTFLQKTVEHYVLRRSVPPADLVIADPPRNGLEKVASLLPKANHLILISCDLANGIRDIRNLRSQGWTVQKIQPFDMFAQTTHIEMLTYLTRT